MSLPPLSNQMFKGIRVIELAQFVFVPAAGAILADLGAEVIKIELVSGDPYRTLKIADGRQTASANLAMEQNSRGKKSIGIDLKTKEGHELLLKLIKTTDIFLTSLRPAALERLNLNIDVLRKHNPKLIYTHGNGLGFHGDEADRPGYDASSFWARGGFAHVLAAPGERPARPRPALGDHIGAMFIAFGIAAALFNRERTDEPSVVETSLLSSAMWALSSDVTVAKALSKEELVRVGSIGRIALKNAYKTSDGRWIQLMFLDPERYWFELCRRIDRTDLLENPLFRDVDSRTENGEALIEVLDGTFAQKNLAEWKRAFIGWDAPWEVIQTIQEVANDPQAIANNYLFDVEVANHTKVTLVSGPVSFNGSAVPISPRRAPHLGEHTDSLLCEIGISEKELQDLKRRNIVV